MAGSIRQKYVIVKGGKFATVGGGLGGKPKVYTTMKAAQYDVDSTPKFKGGVVQPYDGANAAGAKPNALATTTQAVVATTDKGKAAVAKTSKPGTVTTTRAKASTGGKTTTPKRAAAGK